jgi:hypothetical protein
MNRLWVGAQGFPLLDRVILSEKIAAWCRDHVSCFVGELYGVQIVHHGHDDEPKAIKAIYLEEPNHGPTAD